MALKRFFKDLLGGQPPVPAREGSQYAAYTQLSAQGKLTNSTKRVLLITLSHELRLYLTERLKPLIERELYSFEGEGNVEQALHSQVVLLEALPKTNARMHDQYDKILRIKKSMGKGNDVFAVIGRRQDYKKYPRGTYPGLWFFCLTEGDLEHRDADLPLEGLETVEGPRLFNFADLPQAIYEKVKRLAIGKT